MLKNSKGPDGAVNAVRAQSESFFSKTPNSRIKTAEPQEKSRGGRQSRQKGDRFERAIVRLLQDAGFGATRVPLSGSVGGKYSGDISLPLLGRDLCIECKHRADGFRELYAWLEDRDLLIVKADRRDALVILPLKTAIDIAVVAERRRSEKSLLAAALIGGAP
jgi:Holliday junction resolvase